MIYFEDEFKLINKSKDLVLDFDNNLWELIAMFLEVQSNETLEVLNDFIEKEKNSLAFQLSCDSIRARRLINIFTKEKECSFNSFASNVKTIEQLKEKYLLTIFAIRRIELNPSDKMFEEGVLFLINNNISPVAIVKVIEEELIVEKIKTREKINEIFKALGNDDFEWYISKTR